MSSSGFLVLLNTVFNCTTCVENPYSGHWLLDIFSQPFLTHKLWETSSLCRERRYWGMGFPLFIDTHPPSFTPLLLENSIARGNSPLTCQPIIGLARGRRSSHTISKLFSYILEPVLSTASVYPWLHTNSSAVLFFLDNPPPWTS